MNLRKKLLIISHTEHYIRDEQIVGWGPTVTEINFLSQYWEEVVHVACLYPTDAPSSSLPYISSNIRFEPIPPFGGNEWKEKLGVLRKMPRIFATVRNELHQATEVQLRLPTSIGVFLLPWFSLRRRTYTFWVKYAGNWAQENAPLGYAFQRWWLKKNLARCKVTINGNWGNQPSHCISFENPCLFDEELIVGKEISKDKFFEPPFKLLFVGQLNKGKGVQRIIESLYRIDQRLVSSMVFVGDGLEKNFFIQLASGLSITTKFLGFQNRTEVHHVMKTAHFILLPSDSEGFPKVIAEAAAYGVIPIVSDVASIPHYINESNGFLWNKRNLFESQLRKAMYTPPFELSKISQTVGVVALKFSFQAYFKKLQMEILFTIIIFLI